MRRIFIDTLYWVAVTNRKDQWHPAAPQAGRLFAGAHWVTTDEALTEVLTAFCKAGPILRRRAAGLVRDLHTDPTLTISPQSRQTFLAGLALYEARDGKEYSLTDCVSIQTMRAEGPTEVLTHDKHFRQEGFTLLL